MNILGVAGDNNPEIIELKKNVDFKETIIK